MSKEKIPVQDLKYVLENILKSNKKYQENNEKRREIKEKVKKKWQPYALYSFKKFIKSLSSPTKNLYTKEIQRDAEKRKKTFPDLLDQQKIPDSEVEENIFRRNYSKYNNIKSPKDFITFHKQDTFLYLKRGGGGIGHDIKGLATPLNDTHTIYRDWKLIGYKPNYTLFVYKFDKTFSVDKSKIKKYDNDTKTYSGNYFFTYSEQQYSFKYREIYDGGQSHTVDLKLMATLLPLGSTNPQRIFKNGVNNEIQVIDKPVCFSFVDFQGIYLDSTKLERPEGKVNMQIKKFNGKKGFKLEFVCLKILVNIQGQDLEIRVFVLKDSETFKQLQTATFA